MKIKQKLILGFVTIALLIWAVGYLAINTSRKALQKSIGENSVVLASEIMGEIDRTIYSRIETFQEYSKDLILQEFLLESNQEFEMLNNIQSYINENDREWASVPKEEITPFMEELINNRLSKELREKIEYYEQKYKYKVFGEVFVTNKYGANASQTGKTTDYRQDDEQWWQKAKEDGLYVRDVEYDKSADVYSTDIGIRVDDDNGNFLGVIKVVLNIEEAINIIKEAEILAEYQTVEFKLLTRDGKIIYATEEFEFLQDLPVQLSSPLCPVEDEHGHTSYFIAAGDKPGEGKELFAHAHSKGYRDYKDLGWILVVEHETSKIFAPVAKLKNDLLIISLTVTILAVLLGLSISRSIAKPITKLKDAAATIGKGNLDTQIEISSNDEIGELAASFNDMAGKLKESYTKLKESHTQLEEKVKERTTALSSANVKLKEEIQQHTSAQKTLEERIKELNCLTGLSKLIEQPKISLPQIFQETTGLIHSAYQHPDLTCVKITFEGIPYKTDNFQKSEFSQYAKINAIGKKAGDIEVYYLGEKAETGQGPFLKEEQDLLNSAAEHLGRTAERMQAQDKLQLFRDLIDRSNDCVFIKEPEWGRFLDVNKKACEVLGYTREELLEMSVKDIDESMPDTSSWTEHVKQVRQKEYLVSESLLKHKDGTTFPVEENVKFITQDKEYYIIAVARDITERKRMQEQIQRSYETQTVLNKLLNLSLENLTMQDILEQAIDHITSVPWLAFESKGAIFLVEDQPQTLVMKAQRGLATPLQTKCRTVPFGTCMCGRAALSRQIQFADSLDQCHENRYEGISAHGHYCIPILSAGNVLGVLNTYVKQGHRRDEREEEFLHAVTNVLAGIIERKKVEQELQKSAAYLDAMGDPLTVFDIERKIVKVNKPASKLWGYTEEEMLKLSYEQIFPKKEHEKDYAEMKKSIETGSTAILEVYALTKDRKEIPLMLSGTVMKDANAKPVGLIGVYKDITETKQAEEKQVDLLKEIESINKELKDFAYIVSHDLKAPLRGIKTLADWITTDYADKLDDNGKEQINLLSSRVDRMHNLIDGILQYSRVGRVKEKHVQVNLNELVPDIIDTIAPPENITITIENQLPIVECEQTRTTQVFQNLLSNAVKYMDKPECQIKIGSVEEDGFWKFSITDNGPGIEEKNFERIFEIFQTLSPRDEVESTGVGLTVVKKIVELYGGKIWVQSKPGQGSTFLFTLPKQQKEMGVEDARLEEANIVG